MPRPHKCDSCKCTVDFEELVRDEGGDWCLKCAREAWLEGARAAGIPESVIQGRTKLSDHFSKEYIDSQRRPRGEEEGA